MERFIRPNPPTASNFKLANITVAERVKQYKELHEDGGKLFCTPCNKVVDHRRNSTIRDHLSSANHLKRKIETPADIALKRQTTITTRIARHNIAAAEPRIALPSDMCIEQNHPCNLAVSSVVAQKALIYNHPPWPEQKSHLRGA
uniref:Uncharacterized protein n=1 Tax=Sparus aurata TaxID=8175 RepID=A0A671VUT2_SPAAU